MEIDKRGRYRGNIFKNISRIKMLHQRIKQKNSSSWTNIKNRVWFIIRFLGNGLMNYLSNHHTNDLDFCLFNKFSKNRFFNYRFNYKD